MLLAAVLRLLEGKPRDTRVYKNRRLDLGRVLRFRLGLAQRTLRVNVSRFSLQLLRYFGNRALAT
jgi:hypothetical protein